MNRVPNFALSERKAWLSTKRVFTLELGERTLVALSSNGISTIDDEACVRFYEKHRRRPLS